MRKNALSGKDGLREKTQIFSLSDTSRYAMMTYVEMPD